MAKGIFRRIENAFVFEAGTYKPIGSVFLPIGIEAKEATFAVKVGETCVGDMRGARNADQFRLWWKLMQVVADAEDEDRVSISKWCLRKLNMVDVYFDPDGTMYLEAKSLKYESMEQAEFNTLMNAAIPKLAERLGTAPRDLRREFEKLLDPEERAIWKGRAAA